MFTFAPRDMQTKSYITSAGLNSLQQKEPQQNNKVKIDEFLFFMLINFLHNFNWHITKTYNKYEKEWGQNWLKRTHCEKDLWYAN